MKEIRANPLLSLSDVERSAIEIAELVDGMKAPEFLTDRVTRLAAERLLTNIGEALNNLRRIYGEKQLNEHIPSLRDTIRFRNILVHEYKLLEDEETWEYIVGYLPELLEAVQTLIAKETAKADQEIRESIVSYA